MLNIVIPMAGRGNRFSEAGYTVPKPYIRIKSVPMIQLVIENLRPKRPHRFIFLCLRDSFEELQVEKMLRSSVDSCEIIMVDGVTEGAACTVLLAKSYISNNNPLMIANSDQWIESDIDEYLGYMDKVNADGLIMTMFADDPKWSYVRLNSDDRVSEVVEKRVVSNEATVGIYNFRKGGDFVGAAENMVQKNKRVNNEFYIAPTYNEIIDNGASVYRFNVGKVNDGMYGLGTPDDLANFLNLPISDSAIKSIVA